ncbi:YugN-like family protein [Bacillus benzoevorans]|uniref:YugN-like family protein n=1 Tax=Bacillus benzoevorans TaxID=1456 RepID=A0A7X0LXA7_9BACI|nr:YugN-like family protein [Bacillus benzoevorans]MBB6446234.1 hypothetical protein [Bacillus benzoevorans]
MNEIPSKLEGMQFDLYDLELSLKPLGYTIGGNWDYDHGYFDYKFNDEDSYQFVRLPFRAIEGQLDSPGCKVVLGRPFVLSHRYQEGLDDHAMIGNFSASINQFSEPVDPDASLSGDSVHIGKNIVQKLEETLL